MKPCVVLLVVLLLAVAVVACGSEPDGATGGSEARAALSPAAVPEGKLSANNVRKSKWRSSLKRQESRTPGNGHARWNSIVRIRWMIPISPSLAENWPSTIQAPAWWMQSSPCWCCRDEDYCRRSTPRSGVAGSAIPGNGSLNWDGPRIGL